MDQCAWNASEEEDAQFQERREDIVYHRIMKWDVLFVVAQDVMAMDQCAMNAQEQAVEGFDERLRW